LQGNRATLRAYGCFIASVKPQALNASLERLDSRNTGYYEAFEVSSDDTRSAYLPARLTAYLGADTILAGNSANAAGFYFGTTL